MELEHSFTVPVGIERAWEVLLDVETIAPCMPGAALDTVDGDAFTGTVKVKLGPIGLTYKGKASFIEKDAATHRAVIDAQGRDARGNGTAKATVTATLKSAGDASTEVVVATDLAITGKPAQFGRGVMVDVGNKLIGQFADCLAGKLQEPESAQADAGSGGAAAGGDAGAASPAPGTGGGSSEGAGSGAPAAESASTATSTATAGAAAAKTPSSDSAPRHAAGEAGAASSATAGSGAGSGSSTGPRKIAAVAEAEPIDLMASAGPAVAKRLVPVGVAAVLGIVAVLVWRRRR